MLKQIMRMFVGTATTTQRQPLWKLNRWGVKATRKRWELPSESKYTPHQSDRECARRVRQGLNKTSTPV